MLPVHLLLHVIVQSTTAKVSACEVKRVTCMGCGRAYIYQLRRKAVGSSVTVLYLRGEGRKMAAEADAKQKLQKLLKFGVDPVPCPYCGVLQDFMMREVRKRRLRGIGVVFGVMGMALAILWVVVGVGLGAGAEKVAEYATVFWGAGAVVSLAWALLGDLNARAHRRTREVLGTKCRAMGAEEFDALVAEEASPAEESTR